MLRIAAGIDTVNEYTGRLTAYLIVPLILVVTYEVFARYLFNAPTIWAFELTTFIYGVHFVLGFGYTLKHGGHVAIDVFEARLPTRRRLKLRLATGLVLFLPTVGLLAAGAVRYAANSWEHWEKASTSWAPPLYPIKSLMAAGFVLLLLQGVAGLIHDWRSLRENRQPGDSPS